MNKIAGALFPEKTLKSLLKFGATLNINRLHFDLNRLRIIDYKEDNRFAFKHLPIFTKFAASIANILN